MGELQKQANKQKPSSLWNFFHIELTHDFGTIADNENH